MKERAPKILGVPMRMMKPQRQRCWLWSAPRLSRHLSVAVYPMGETLRARIWILGIPTCVDECDVVSVADGARWADRKLRGLVKALWALQGRA